MRVVLSMNPSLDDAKGRRSSQASTKPKLVHVNPQRLRGAQCCAGVKMLLVGNAARRVPALCRQGASGDMQPWGCASAGGAVGLEQTHVIP